uniref:Mitochondrial carrier protein n=1 Tax=Panagrolaimus sp. JU765 TaxID=591449 RepID=A0AC34RHY3_9BILA
MSDNSTVFRSLICGGVGSLAVDVALYPIDTIKTRLQTEQGFKATEQGFKAVGGFRHLYRGLSSVVIGTAPNAALFFFAYEQLKVISGGKSNVAYEAMCAGTAEFISCLTRVPIEVLKQRAQIGSGHSLLFLAKRIIRRDGFIGLYRGFGPMIALEIPFSFIEIPVWEFLRRECANFTNQEKCGPFQSAVAGSIAGCFAAVLTTPLDVTKTRIMLSDENKSMWKTLFQIRREEGIRKLFAGTIPRTAWMGFGGFVFFFAFEAAHDFTYRYF